MLTLYLVVEKRGTRISKEDKEITLPSTPLIPKLISAGLAVEWIASRINEFLVDCAESASRGFLRDTLYAHDFVRERGAIKRCIVP